MTEQNIMELIKLVQGTARSEAEQIEALAAMADAPGDDFAPTMRLPTVNDLPAFKVGNGGIGSKIAGLDHGIAGPVPGQERTTPPTLGELLIGDTDGL